MCWLTCGILMYRCKIDFWSLLCSIRDGECKTRRNRSLPQRLSNRNLCMRSRQHWSRNRWAEPRQN